MANAIEQLKSGLVVGHAILGRRGQQPGSVAQQVHDGDTVTTEATGNLGVRFLGVDAPELSVPLPGTRLPFVDLDDPRWEPVLADPFSAELDPIDPPLDGELQQHLARRVGPGTAANHARLADAATKALEGIVGQDLQELGRTKEDFRFFLAFAGEVVDRYGRLLAYLHPDQADIPAAGRKLSYNERLLAAGWVSPYFVWPNANPFRRAPSVAEAVPGAGHGRAAGGAGAVAAPGPPLGPGGPRPPPGAVRAAGPDTAAAVWAALVGPPAASRPLGGRPWPRRRRAGAAPVLLRGRQPRGPAVRAGRVRAPVRGAGMATRVTRRLTTATTTTLPALCLSQLAAT